MTDGEIVREYRTAKDKKAQIRIMAELTLKPKEEIVRILKENGCDVEEKRRGRKPKAEEAGNNSDKPVRRRRRSKTGEGQSGETDNEAVQDSSADKNTTGSSADETTNGNTDGSSSDKTTTGGSADGSTNGSSSGRNTNGSSAIPYCVWNAVRERYKYLGYSIEQLKKQIEEQSKELAELMEFIDQNGILEKDLVR